MCIVPRFPSVLLRPTCESDVDSQIWKGGGQGCGGGGEIRLGLEERL